MNQAFRKLLYVSKRDGFRYTAKRIIAWLIAHSPLRDLSFKYHQGLRLTFAKSMLTYGLFASSTGRSNDDSVIEKYLKPGNIMIDVGAHIGSLSLIAANKVGETGKVLAFEPSPKFFAILQKNISLNNLTERIKSYQVALGNSEGTVYLNEAVNDDTTNHIAKSGTPVPSNTLDAYTQNLDAIHLLKIDVEGYEYEVLSGAQSTLKKTKVVYIEFITNVLAERQVPAESVLQTLNAYFTLYTEDGNSLVPFIYDSHKDYAVNLIGITK